MNRRSFLKLNIVGTSSLMFPSFAFSKTHFNCDVVIVGAGAAGLSAAVSAAVRGLSVVVVEKNGEPGGNTWISGGYYSAVNPTLQDRMGIEDSVEFFYEQTLEAGKRKNNFKLTKIMCSESLNSLKWLESMGMRFHPMVMESIGALWPRCHKPLLPDGQGYIRILSMEAHRLGVKFLLRNIFSDLILDKNNKVSGCVIRDSDGKFSAITAKRGVILAAGGFGGNLKMVARYNPLLSEVTTDNVPSASGEALLIAASHGAALDDMDQVECLPGCPKGHTLRIRFHVDVPRFILVDNSGKRFIREDCLRDELRDALLSVPGQVAYAIIDNRGYKSFSSHIQRDAVLGIESGDAFIADTVEELALKMGIPPHHLIATIESYNEGVRSQKDRFGKHHTKLLYEIQEPPFWSGLAGITVHSTLGGIRIDEKAKCLRQDSSVIKGLFAAGEITAGLHGVNRVGGNGLLDAVVFGRLAGTNIGSDN